MTPIWIFPAYPLLIIGPHAGVLSQTVVQRKAFDIIVAGFTLQGIGFLVSMMIYSAFIYRLMTQKLPQESTRPGMFVSVGPSGFTVAGVIGMAEGAQRALPTDFMGDSAVAAMILKVVQLPGYTDHRLCHDANPDLCLVLRCGNDDSGNHFETDPVAAEG